MSYDSDSQSKEDAGYEKTSRRGHSKRQKELKCGLIRIHGVGLNNFKGKNKS
jgi:hypothetical protein